MAPALGLSAGFPAIETAHAQSPSDGLKWRHGVSTFGDIKYPAGFKRFDFGYASAASVCMLVLTVIIAQSFVKRFFRSARD